MCLMAYQFSRYWLSGLCSSEPPTSFTDMLPTELLFVKQTTHRQFPRQHLASHDAVSNHRGSSAIYLAFSWAAPWPGPLSYRTDRVLVVEYHRPRRQLLCEPGVRWRPDMSVPFTPQIDPSSSSFIPPTGSNKHDAQDAPAVQLISPKRLPVDPVAWFPKATQVPVKRSAPRSRGRNGARLVIHATRHPQQRKPKRRSDPAQRKSRARH